MNLKELIHFSYGLIMGTSVQYVKPTKRFLWPTTFEKQDEQLALFYGGSGTCGVLSDGANVLLINVNQGVASEELGRQIPGQVQTVILNSLSRHFSGGLGLFSSAESIFVGSCEARELRAELGDMVDRCTVVRESLKLSFAGETLHLVPVGAVATSCDMAVFLESRSMLFLGPLFFNHIHPVVSDESARRVPLWIETLENLLARFQPRIIVPAEGEVAGVEEVRDFIAYLRDLTNPEVEFQTCRQKYDWQEIPSYTSLEENFDLLHDQNKTHTTLRI